MRYRQGLVSVCLPVYNGERYLDGAIESVLSQSYENLELIIFDDFSTDHSLEIIEGYAAKDNRISHWRNARRLGLIETYNQCLGQAAGQFIKPFSQDDLLRTPALSKCVAQLLLEPTSALVTVGYEVMDARSNLLKTEAKCGAKVFEPRMLIAAGEVLEKCLFPLTNYLGEVSSIMFKAQYQGTGFDSRLHHFADIDYWLRIIMQGDYVAIPDTYAFVRHHLGSAAVNNSRNLMGACDLIKIARKFSRVLEACGKTEEEFLDVSIAAYIAQIEELLADGTITASRLGRAQDLRSRAETSSAHDANASATAAFSALASALVGGDVSCVSFSPQPTETATAILQDLIDFREFSFHAIRLLANGGLANATSRRPATAAAVSEVTALKAASTIPAAVVHAAPGAIAGANQNLAAHMQTPTALTHETSYQDMAIFEVGSQEIDDVTDLKQSKMHQLNHILAKPLKALTQTTTRAPKRGRDRRPVGLL